ncbi:MAG: hypothetical protein Q4E07_00850 [Eubacteriales bacterium]|nr:hypothetical protein [Eubacteriales bacterium]
MKKTLSWLFTLSLLMSLAVFPAQAADKIKVDLVKEFTLAVGTPSEENTVFFLTNQGTSAVNVTVTVYDEALKQNVETVYLTLNPGDAPLGVMAKVYKFLPKKGNINLYRYTIKSDGGYKRVVSFAQMFYDVDPNTNQPVYMQYYNHFYRNNTASSFGPHFRDVVPGSTKLWYMFTVLDLTKQGRQTYELVASNMYVIGEVYVDVYGDTVTVTYHNFYDGKGGNTETTKEFLGIYNSYADVVLPDDNPTKSYNNPPTNFQFGMPFSITYDLGGDTNVLMLVRNVVNYHVYPRPENTQFRRFWENIQERKTLREQMLQFMDPVQGAVLFEK